MEIRGQEDQGTAWLTQIEKDAGFLSNLKCPEITRVRLITKEDGIKIFVPEQTGHADAKERQQKIDIKT